MKGKNRMGKRLAAALLLAASALTGCYFHGSGGGESGAPASLVLKGVMTGFSGTVKVTGEGMTDVSASVGANGESVSVEIPSGRARTVTLTFVGATATLEGSTTIDVSAGTTVNVKVPLRLKSNKLVIPDAANARLVQMDDMAGTNWKAKAGTDLNAAAGPLDFLPFYIDLDNKGRIYIGNGSYGTVLPFGLLRIPDIDRTAEYEVLAAFEISMPTSKIFKNSTPKPSSWKKAVLPKLAAKTSSGLVSKSEVVAEETPGMMAIDRTNDYCYLTTNYVVMDSGGMMVRGRIYRADVSGSTFTPSLVYDVAEEFGAESLPSFFVFDNISLDPKGYIYVICSMSEGEDTVAVLRVDLSKPVGSRTLFFTGETLEGMPDNVGPPVDMQVMGKNMYVFCAPEGEEPIGGIAMLAVDLDMNYKGYYGTLSLSPSLSTAGEFFLSNQYIRFLRGALDAVYIMDDDPYAGGGDRIIRFNDISGAGWTTYGSTGSGTGQFQFYEPMGF